MTGPPFPRPVEGAGSSAIGEFIIGESAIESTVVWDVWKTVISQYANSPILTTLITNFDECIDQTANFQAFYNLIWNVDTAVGIGLDIWGRIVGVTRTVNVGLGGKFFGFQEGGTVDYDPFGQSPFYHGTPLTTNVQLSDSAFRTLIFAKALSNITDGSIKSINQLLLNLFPGRGNAYVVDGEDMTMVFKFDFGLSPVEIAIVNQSGALPKPGGVQATIVHL